jgi:hypothetical protein
LVEEKGDQIEKGYLLTRVHEYPTSTFLSNNDVDIMNPLPESELTGFIASGYGV